MADPSLQLLVHGQGISKATVLIEKPGIFLKEVRQTDNPNYLFLDLEIESDAKPGSYNIVFDYQREIMATFEYVLKEREPGSRDRQGFGPDDVIYLVMPDRFANGDPGNDNMEGMLESANREDPNGRHGGDLKGIRERLDYIDDLGVTALWLNPVLENNMPKYSYHGYAITDYYKVDDRFGGNKAYLDFIKACHKKDLKVIMDMVFNHCGSYHWWMSDLPSSTWIHQFPEFTRSNYRSEALMDPYASDFDRTRMMNGWFDVTMPDLDQTNEFLANYLIQNSIWWIEYAGLDGIRMDTYPYSDKDFMVQWIRRVRMEYPGFNVVGETWLQKEAHTAYFQDNALNGDGYDSDLPTVTDFPMYFALTAAFNEADGWTTGLSRLYYVLSHDYLYPDAMNTLVFADNHDLSRYFSSVNENFNSWKMAMAFLLTTRGTPMIYYGTELLMTGKENQGHGFIRQDFPLWDHPDLLSNIAIYQFNNLIPEAHDYLRTLLNWRKDEEVIHSGMLKQFVPQDGIYVYFRYNEKKTVMVILNNSEQEKKFGWERFAEATNGFEKAEDILDGSTLRIGEEFMLMPKSVKIQELVK
jgi:neopullulanase